MLYLRNVTDNVLCVNFSFQNHIFGVFGPKTKGLIDHIQSIADVLELPQILTEPVETQNRNWSAVNFYPNHIAYSQVQSENF